MENGIIKTYTAEKRKGKKREVERKEGERGEKGEERG